MRRVRWLAALAIVVLAGCEPAEVDVRLRSARRIEETVTAVVPPADEELTTAAVKRLLPDRWQIRRQTLADNTVLLEFQRLGSLRERRGASFTRQVAGPLRLRFQYHLSYELAVPSLPAEHPARAALKSLPVVLRLHLPGRVTEAGGAGIEGGAAVVKLTAGELLGQAKRYEVTSHQWRWWLIGFWVLVVALALYVIWPWVVPPPEGRQERLARRAAKQLRAEAKRQARALKAQQAAEDAARPEPPPKPRRRRRRPEGEEAEGEPEPAAAEPEAAPPAAEEAPAETPPEPPADAAPPAEPEQPKPRRRRRS
ncbi:MAG: hypothetical protein HYU66_18095 [Armatimonadetes bacterium]|nr:hypothetical protein [Armatimonadota bacterium]